ncbi:P43 5S RNA-binding protein-like [Brienomyrus brachyistius]|uniref:P43 5S RNA-binding protein-like n=1 Tax=Brienomyrus brachyistius TaxID=42636 RepID=UPI0020B23442|nr:P43 5S RNA-binding protein-like [Brienomyrus brachyistius]
MCSVNISEVELVSGLRRFACLHIDCEAKFTKEWRLKEHQTLHTGERPLLCRVPGCGHRFSRKSHLRRHHLCHSGEKRFRCADVNCAMAFFNADKLRRHVRYAHGDKDKYFKCQYPDCTETFSKRKAYKRHLNLHSPTPSFKCTKDGCQAIYTTIAARHAHERTHAGYACPYPACHVVEYTWGNLCKHVKRHPVTFSCKKCEKTFGKRSALRRHARCHAKKPVLLCPSDDCHASFSTPFNLEHHIRKVHLKLLKFTCYYPDCHRAFAMQESLNRHILHHDPERSTVKQLPAQRDRKIWQKSHQPPLVEDDLRRLFSLHMRFTRRGKLEADLSGLFNERKIRHLVDPEVNLHDLFSLKPPCSVAPDNEAMPVKC